MKEKLLMAVEQEEKIAMAKWGAYDTTPELLLNALTEELGEVAHAVNHREGKEAILQEIVETIGVLSRLYNMVLGGRPQCKPPKGYEDVEVKCTECGWGGKRRDCGFGHNDFYCPECGRESVIEKGGGG